MTVQPQKHETQSFIRWRDKKNAGDAVPDQQTFDFVDSRQIDIIWDTRYYLEYEGKNPPPYIIGRLDITPDRRGGNPHLVLDGRPISDYLDKRTPLSQNQRINAYMLLAECKRSGLFGVRPQPKDVLYYLNKAADYGHHRAHLILSQAYKNGDTECGIDTVNKSAYAHHLKLAAERGNDIANWLYYKAYSDVNGNQALGIKGIDAERAKQHFWRAVDACHPKAMFVASNVYRNYKNVASLQIEEPNPQMAQFYFWKAAHFGSSDALYCAYEYYNKTGCRDLDIAPDKDKAVQYFWAAVKANNRDAHYHVSQKYRSPDGDSRFGIHAQNIELYRKYHWLAVKGQQRDALWITCQAFRHGSPQLQLEPDEKRYIDFFWAAVENKQKDACWMAHKLYKYPQSYPEFKIEAPDKEMARYYLQRAVDACQPDALWKMAWKYRDPDEGDAFYGIHEPDIEKATAFLERAATNGHAMAQFICMAEALNADEATISQAWANRLLHNRHIEQYGKRNPILLAFKETVDLQKDLRPQITQLYEASGEYSLPHQKPN